MARFTGHISTPRKPIEAFEYMANLDNFADWDPGIRSAVQVAGDGPGEDAAWEFVVKGFTGDMTMRYEVETWEPPQTLVLRSETNLLNSLDTITIVPDLDRPGGGSLVTYDAVLTMNGPLGLADPLLDKAFDKVGNAAVEGLTEALDGERIDDDRASAIADAVDAVLEWPVVSSFTRLGYEARSRLDDWTDLDDYDLAGRVMLLTGATSGLGLAAAHQLARCGATLVLVGRSEDRNETAAAAVRAASGNERVTTFAADMGDFDQVRVLADHVLAAHDRLDVIMHNAGALLDERREAPSGIEATVASQVVGPFLLTSLLLERLAGTGDARVITMSSGGMYTAGLSVKGLQMSAADYRGTDQYAKAKRAQVTLNEEWAERFADAGVVFHALHPGWADTPGVADALPGFGKLMGPMLRTAEQGADTMVWLAADDDVLESNGGFWLDRRERSIHKIAKTRTTDTATRRTALWDWVADAAGITPSLG